MLEFSEYYHIGKGMPPVCSYKQFTNHKIHASMSIPKALYESVKELIDSLPELGYTTPAEFCKDAIRRRISSIRKEYMVGKNDVEHIIAEIRRAMNYEGYRSLFDSVGCAFAVFSNPDGALITWNKRFLDIFGYSEADAKGKSFYDFIVPEDVPRVEENFRAKTEGLLFQMNVSGLTGAQMEMKLLSSAMILLPIAIVSGR